MRYPLLALVLIASTTAIAARHPASSPPAGMAKPENRAIQEALDQIEKNNPDAAEKVLAAINPATPLDKLWKSYATGLALFEEKKPEEGYKFFIGIYDEVRATKTALPPETFRILGAALKKVGWYWREKKEFEKAYAFHEIEYNYYTRFGSALEIHDACISLDIDAFDLGDVRQSEQWLRTSLKAAAKISEPVDKSRSLGMSYNNLAETLYIQQRFEEAVSTIDLAFKYWSQYEKETGNTKEFRVAWAYFSIGDVYENWARFLKNSGKPYARQRQLALENYQHSLELADKQGMAADDRKSIADTIRALDLLN
jgi:tetratricopeptide (TPR) repeat protein